MAVGAAEPAVGAAEPVVGAAEPVVGAAEPAVGAAEPVVGAAEPVVGAACLANGSTIAPVDDGRAGSDAVASARDGFAAPECTSVEWVVGGAVDAGGDLVADDAVAAGRCDGDPDAVDEDGGGSIGVMIGAEGNCAAAGAEFTAGSRRARDDPG